MTPDSTRKQAGAMLVSRALVRRSDKTVRIEARLGNLVEVPAELVTILRRATQAMARGDEVELLATGQLVSTQRAADLLNVSRQTVVRLIDAGKLPCVRVGTHRRIHLVDVRRLMREQMLKG